MIYSSLTEDLATKDQRLIENRSEVERLRADNERQQTLLLEVVNFFCKKTFCLVDFFLFKKKRNWKLTKKKETFRRRRTLKITKLHDY